MSYQNREDMWSSIETQRSCFFNLLNSVTGKWMTGYQDITINIKETMVVIFLVGTAAELAVSQRMTEPTYD
jgi:hypothetical protein